MFDNELEKVRMKKENLLMKRLSMPNNIINISNNQEFYDVLQNYPDSMIIIDFWASWCGPCIAFKPTFEKIQQEYSNDFIFLKVNIDAVPEIANQYRITAIPTTLSLKNSGIVHKVVGAINYDTLKQVLEKLKSNNH